MIRTRLGIGLVLLFAVYAAGRNVLVEAEAWRASAPADTVAAHVARYAPVRAYLPEEARVQFVPPPGAGRAAFWFHLATAQHALAPILLDTLPRPARAVVVFPGAALPDSLAVEATFGRGVVVARRRPSR